jgi:hypothetical protein
MKGEKMNKNYGFIIHPEDHQALMDMTPAEVGFVVKNMIRVFKGEEPEKFDDRFLAYVSDDLCGRVLRDIELSEKQSRNGKKGGAPKGNTNANKPKQPKNNPDTTQKQPKTNPNTNTNTNTNINNNIGFKPNAFTSGCTSTDYDFEELEKTLIKN